MKRTRIWSAPKTRKSIKPSIVFDIETSNWTEFLCGTVYDFAKAEVRRYNWKQEADMAADILSTEGEAWAHNGGRFDAKWLLRHILKGQLEARLTVAGARIISIKAGRCQVLDSAALFPMSLKDLTAESAIRKSECPIPFSRFSRQMSQADFATVMDYCERDSRALACALDDFAAFAEENDLDLCATVGGSSWRNAARRLNLPAAQFSMTEHLKLRQAYYGGRVEVYQRMAKAILEYDINSAYPAALAFTALPCGKADWLSGGDARQAFTQRRPGIYGARVDVPRALHLPPLPARTRDGLLYPTGSWGGWYALPELAHAASLGVTVDVQSACVFEGAEPVLKPWVEAIWELRHAAGKKTARGKFCKWYPNSLTGRLGMRPVRQTLHLWPSDGPKEGWEEISDSPQVFTELAAGLEPCCHVVWSAYLTAATRIKLHQQQLAGSAGGRDCVYSDTDSVLCEGERGGVGDGLGQWERGGPFENFEALAPKVYRYGRAGTAEKVRAKGFRMPDGVAAQSEAFEVLKAGGELRWTGPLGLRRAMASPDEEGNAANDPFVAREQHRQLRPVAGWLGGRQLDENGITTHPPHVGSALDVPVAA